MANNLISAYLADTSIPADTRRNIATGINSGDLSEAAAVQGITGKYGDKYGKAADNMPATVNQQVGKTVAQGLVKAANPANWAGMASQALSGAAPAIAKGMAAEGAKMTPEEKTQAYSDEAARNAQYDQKVANEAKIGQGLNKRGIEVSTGTPYTDEEQATRVANAPAGQELPHNIVMVAGNATPQDMGNMSQEGLLNARQQNEENMTTPLAGLGVGAVRGVGSTAKGMADLGVKAMSAIRFLSCEDVLKRPLRCLHLPISPLSQLTLTRSSVISSALTAMAALPLSPRRGATNPQTPWRRRPFGAYQSTTRQANAPKRWSALAARKCSLAPF